MSTHSVVSARWQRGWNAQPVGRLAGSGGDPGTVGSTATGDSNEGRHSRSRWVYGMGGVVEHLADLAGLRDSPGVHHHDPVRDLGQDAEIVRDDDDAGAELVPRPDQQVKHLSLDRDVKRSRRLIGEDQFR